MNKHTIPLFTFIVGLTALTLVGCDMSNGNDTTGRDDLSQYYTKYEVCINGVVYYSRIKMLAPKISREGTFVFCEMTDVL